MPARTLSADENSLKMDATLSILNPLPARLEGPELLHELISGPEKDGIALEYLDADGQKTYLSYFELHRKAEQLALRLVQVRRQASQETPGIVPIFIPQSPSLYISQLAILKSGAAFCPLNLDVPEERLKFILKDTSARVLLTTSAMQSQLPELEGICVVSMDEENSGVESEQTLAETLGSEQSTLDQSPLAYIMYTSGSTGLPKAVCLSHSAVTQSLLAHDKFIPDFSRFLQFAAPTFDVSVFEIFFPWFRGATLVSCERGRLLGDLPGTITALNIDAAELTPSVAASLVRTRANVPTLRALLTIGEMLNAQVIKQFGDSDDQPGILYGMYGPTEAAIHCTLQPKFACDLPAGTIGIPLDTVSCFIVKPAESPERAGEIEILPIGEIGELAVGGHQLANGYLNREEQTRAAFVTHPKFGDLYRTGDKARLHRNGTLECHGRISSGQVKLRGQRVELGEIEHAASKVAGCHAVIASVISGLLVVFCIVENNVTTAEVKAACRKWLPNYMVPSDVVLLEDFPYLPSGKTDKKKLESDYKSRITESAPETDSLSEDARKIAQVIQNVLHVTIDQATDLGAAGVDSLKAIQIASELRREGYASISALELLSAHTLLDLEALLRSGASQTEAQDEQSTSSWQKLTSELQSSVFKEPEISAMEKKIQEILPCTPLQDAMLSETARQPQAYCNSLTLSLSNAITFEQLRDSLMALAEKHSSLRSGFWTSGVSHCSYAQIVWKHLDPCQIVSIEHWDSEFSVLENFTLLHPLRFQYKKTDDSVELLVQIHHALYDQWSIEIMLEDLDLLLRGKHVSSRPSFAAVNQFFSIEKSKSRPASMDFWQEYLSGVTSGRLPHLNAKSLPAKSLQATEHLIRIDMPALRQAAKIHSCSPHVFFQSVYAILLGMYMGSEDVTFGTVFSGRTLPIAGIEDIVGPILSTLPSRINTAEGRRFVDILRRLHGDNREIMQHSTIPLADIKKACGATPGEALFDSIFVWQETARSSTQESPLVRLADARDYLEFNLTLELEPVAEGVKAKATYQPHILPLQQVNIFLQQMEELVKHVVAEPAALMSDLSNHLPESLLSIANPRPCLFEYHAGLGSVVEKHALASSEKPALVFAGDIGEQEASIQALTYGELNTRANRLAHLLISNGTKPDELVCVCMEKSIDLYVAILAVVKAGAGYLPLVPETPSARIQQILSDADVKLCLTDAKTTETVAELNCCRVFNVPSTDVSAQSDATPKVQFRPTNIAYAVFTSGTTGRPKGVLVTQENILSNLETLGRIYPVPEGSRLLQACTQAFDVSVFEIFFSWYTGMCLCSASKDVLFRDFEKSINKLDITHLSLTPTVAALANPAHVPKVRFLVAAGEAVTYQVHGAWAGKGLYHGYGPSEATNICTVNPAVEPNHAINNIGSPFENTSAFVLEQGSHFRILPTGSLGELCFGGQQVFRGYQNMPEVNQSKIIEHPEFGRIYRSGDLGRLLPDGTILIQGRTDDQRKLRGQRIELGEISSCLLQMSNVQDCAVDIINFGQQSDRLVAFWIPQGYAARQYSILAPNDTLRDRISSLFAHLADRLPVYMIPDALVAVTAIPMTLQGKIDRKRLAADALSLSTDQMNHFAQAFDEDVGAEEMSDTEEKLVSALVETLQVSSHSVGRSTSFFALGLDSLSAIRFSTRLRTEYGYRIDVSQILKRPSVSRLAMMIDQDKLQQPSLANGEKSNNIDAVLRPDLRDSIAADFRQQGQAVLSVLPCTPLQEAMLSAGSTTSSAYRNKSLFKLEGDLEKMKASWKTMIQRHEILRTAFSATEDARFPFVQVVLSEFTLPWKESQPSSDDPKALLEPSEDSDNNSAMEYTPPWEMHVYRVGSDTYLLLDMHHALYDANAMSNLLQEVEKSYLDDSMSEPTSFAGFLDYMLSSGFEEADKYFGDHLQNYIPKPFRRSGTNASQHGFGIVVADVPLSSALIDDFVKKHSITMLGLAQAVWAKVLSFSQSYSDICFGNVVSGRSVPVEGVQSLVAPCFNTIPVRMDLSKCRSNLSLIKALQKSNVDALPYQLTPLRRIHGHSAFKGHRLFDSLVLLQQEPTPLNSRIWSFEGETGEMNFPCIVEFTPNDDTFSVSLHFDRSYFSDEDAVHKLHLACLSAFVSCVKYPSSDVLDFVDFNENLIAGSLKPDETIMQSAEAAIRTSSGTQNGQASTNEPWSPIELQIRAAFSTISSTPEERISRDTTIYRLGLDSISAIQVASRLRKKGFSLQASDVMESPTCLELGSVIQSRTATPNQATPAFDLESFDKRYRQMVTANHAIPSKHLTSIRPCTAVQSGMLSQYVHSGAQQYFNHTFYAMDLETSVERLKLAWMKVVAEHEMLRTGFTSTDDNDNPFVMLTYKDLEVDRTWLKFSAKGQFIHREQAALDAVKDNLHLPPWRWDLFKTDNELCLQFSAHHALFDAESLRLITSDLRTALTDQTIPSRGGIDSALSFILTSSQSDRDSQRSFWSQQLGGAPVTRFPNLSPIRVPEQETVVLQRTFKSTRSKIEARCQEIGISMQSLGQAAWARLLSAYTGETHVTFGVVYSGRTASETADSPFPCITTLPVASNTTVEDGQLLQDLMAYNAGVQRYQFTPLTDIQKYAELPNEALFDTLFAYQRPLGQDASPSWEIVYEKASVELAVSVEMEALSGDCLGLRLTINPAQIPSAQGEIMLHQMEELISKLAGIGSSLDKSTLAIVPPKDPVISSSLQYLHQMAEVTIDKFPDRIALEFVDSLDNADIISRHWTYRQLDEEANRIAHLLVSRGVKPGNVVATSFDKCPEASFAFLGILKAGCAFCAIDPTAPTARKAFILQDSGASIMLTTAAIRSDLQETTACDVVDLLNFEKESLPAHRLSISDMSPSFVSYVLYTSGTTGTPKGCELTHENAVQALLAFQRLFQGRWTDQSRWLQFASYHFDVSVLEQFWSWSVGIRLVSAPRDLVLEDIMGFLDTLKITHLDLTPSLGRLLDPAMVPSLHNGVFITGGEAVKQDIINTWGDVGCLFNFYGPTECTIGVTTFPSVPKEGKPSNIGWQFDNVGSYVLTPGTHNPVLRGAVGELCISGKLVGKGYLNRPELTEDRFPFLEAFGERVYRTGDSVRLLHDGSFDFLGRQDNQVKLRGQRLEIDEIEAVIHRCPDIQDTVCLVAKHPKQQKDQLIGFVALSSNRRQGKPELCPAESTKHLIQMAKTACEDHLPGYMVPTHFLPIQRIPLSVNNKVEEKLLRQLYADMSTTDVQAYAMQSDSQKPLNGTERKVAEELAELLKIDVAEVHPASNIFALGLNSISAIQFSRKLKSAGFSNAQVAAIIKNPIISKLTKAISTSSGQAIGEIITAKQTISACRQRYLGIVSRTLGLKMDEIETVAPCTPLQQGIISRSLASESTLYFNTFRYDAQGLDQTMLQNAFQEAANKTQILRTVFVETDDGYVQVVKKSHELPRNTLEINSTDSIEKALADQRNKWRSANSLHLTMPFKVVVVQSGSDVILAVHIHHALYDGNSFELLMNNIIKLHKSHQADFGKPFTESLPYGPLRDVQGAKEFWLDHLSGVNPTSMPSLIDQTADEDTLFATSLEIIESANQLRRSLGVTTQALIQACWVVTLRKYYGGAIGTVVSGRSIDFDGIESVIGPLFNTVPFCPRLGNEDSWQNLVRRCHDYNTSALPYQHTPLRDIMKWCNKGRSEPLFDTLFVFQNGTMEPSEANSVLVPREDGHFEADYPLSFEAEEATDGKLMITIAAKATICDTSKARELVEEFHAAFSAMIQNPEGVIGASVDHEFAQPARAVNGNVLDTQIDGAHDFDWTPEAVILRTEMASLAAVDETEINEQTSIFEVGLDSVDAVKLSSRLKKKGLALAVSTIMQSQTVAKMSATLSKNREDDKRPQAQDVFHDLETKLIAHAENGMVRSMNAIERILPASPMQEALVSEMIRSNYQAYFNHDVLKIPSSVDLEKLEQAWRTVVAASPILRTGFQQIEDPDLDITFAQVIHKTAEFDPINKVELPSSEAVTGYLQHINGWASTEPLFVPQIRLTLVTTPDEHYLILSIAHALYDGHSLSLLHQDVYCAYHGQFTARPYYEEVLQDAFSASNDDATMFWRSLLSGARKTHLPRASSENEEVITYRAERSSQIPANDLATFSRQQGVTLQAVCQTAWTFVLAHTVRALDVIFGVVLAGRDSELAEQVMFPTMNTVIMRSVLHGSRKDVLQNIQATIADIAHHQHFPLRRIQASCQGEVRASPDGQEAFFDTLFTYQKRPDGADDESEELYHSVNGSSDVEYPIAIEAEVVNGGLIWRTACKSSVFDAEGVEKLLSTLDQVLRGIVSRPDEPSLTFQDQTVSICGLSGFAQQEEVEATPAPSDQPEDNNEWSELELTIRQVIAKVTRTPEEEISKTVNIQNLGVDSINAIKLCALLRGKAIKISVSNVIRAGSVAKIAAAIAGDKDLASSKPTESSEETVARFMRQKHFTAEHFGYHAKDLEQILPATAGQVYTLSAWQATAGRIFYPDFEYLIKTETTIDRIERAWRDLVATNSILRTVFVATKDADVPFVQLVLRDPPSSFVDLDAKDNTDGKQPFVRLAVHKSQQGFKLHLKIHHALYDAVSLPLLIQNLANNIQSITPQSPSVTFTDFVALNLDSVKRKEFWIQYLSKTSPCSVPSSAPAHKARHIETFDPRAMSIDSQFEVTLRKEGVSLQSLFFAAYAKAFLTLNTFGDREVVMGIYLANRTHLDNASNLAAPTLNLVPLRIRSPAKTPLVNLAKQVQADLQEIGKAEHSGVGLWEIAEWTGIKIDTFVNFIKLPDEEKDEKDAIIVIDEGAEKARVGKRSKVSESTGKELMVPKELRSSVVDAYPRTLDIEATVANGELGVGVFGWDDMIGLEQAEKLGQTIVKEIKAVSL